jgi:hypothetical protein
MVSLTFNRASTDSNKRVTIFSIDYNTLPTKLLKIPYKVEKLDRKSIALICPIFIYGPLKRVIDQR